MQGLMGVESAPCIMAAVREAQGDGYRKGSSTGRQGRPFLGVRYWGILKSIVGLVDQRSKQMV